MLNFLPPVCCQSFVSALRPMLIQNPVETVDNNFSGWDLVKWLERLTAYAVVATVLGSIPASSGTVESEGRQIKGAQAWDIRYRVIFTELSHLGRWLEEWTKKTFCVKC